MAQSIAAAGLATPQGPFSPAVLATGTRVLVISGQIAQDADGAPVASGDVEAQARRVLAQIDALLTAAGATRCDVIKVTIFLTDIGDRAAVARARHEFFGDHRPAATLVEVSALVAPPYLVEIEATAVF